MADRATFDLGRSGTGDTIGKGRYVARLKTDGVERSYSQSKGYLAPGTVPSPGGRLSVPEASITQRKGLQITSGASNFAVARDRGMQSVPVAMTMDSWKAAKAKGLISPDGAGKFGNSGRRATAQADVFLQIDLSDMWNLAAQLNGVATAIRSGHVVISRAINFGMRRLKARLTDQAKTWTGIQRRSEIAKGFKILPSSPATLTGVLRVRDYHRAVTAENFGATWSRSNPGATHRAWNRSQLAVGTFMVRGRKPIFRRVGKGRFPIEPLWGPNVAREIERHRPAVQTQVNLIAIDVQREAVALMRVAITGSRRS
ncbi:MAG: hypothetical protein ACOYLQ_09540 [Hyphomicrobiaceae bacterium]